MNKRKKRIYNNRTAFNVKDADCITKCMTFIESELETIGIEANYAFRAELLSEEMTAFLIENSTGDGEIRIQVKKMIGDTIITISAKGNEFDLFGDESRLSDDLDDDEAEYIIRSIILRSHGENLKYSCNKGINRVRISLGDSEVTSTKLTIAALVLGILFGLVVKFCMPEAAAAGVCEYLLSPVSTMFMNALRIVIAPVVFFSIVTCISGFGNLAELGRIGIRIMSLYLLTTVLAVVMAYGVTTLCSPGKFGAGLAMTGVQSVEVNTDIDTSLLNTIINIVPSNIVRPFLEANTLQLIFLAVMIGIALGKIGKYTPVLNQFFEACNSLFLTITTMIAKFIPIAVFCSVSMMLIKLGGSSFLSLLGYAATNLLEIFIMLMIYGVLVLVLGRVNPLTFYRKNKEGMLTSFTLSSSSAAMPVNLSTCTEKLGISPKVCNFSIPLGATINMDGTCISLILQGLYLAKMYGVTVTPSMVPTLMITIILLSLGCPGVPGAGLVCLGIVLTQLGVPVGSIGLILAIDPVLDMFDAMSNTTGDVACALITASREGLLDRKILNDMSRV